MDAQGLIQPVHFLKIAHHGSRTGLPPDDILAKLLPVPAPDNRPRSSVVSTFPGTYSGVPDQDTLTKIGERTTLQSTEDLPANELFVEVRFHSA
jgi:hypothetical protein